MSIAVVPPREPVLVEGGVLEVGTLSDEFDRAVLERQLEMTDTPYAPQEAYTGSDWSPPPSAAEPQTHAMPSAPTEDSVITSTDPLADGSRLFGFDRGAIVAPPAVERSASTDAIPQRMSASQDFFQ
ncbi:hypothetical protein BZG35_04075 [Brevundimonas sp. LM2]|uniref:hypothetical protein n=1 Tax=Brevundimonas sp. LM2 TaxID=1938605 RepID=UPI000983942E|nr:hypothetical protein [Brevundimonas sp. LM2]AQR60920.1 hypothetical protein BZG35_04075 [Brevundimonas sp. LM2]